jgi:hypothetical protein
VVHLLCGTLSQDSTTGVACHAVTPGLGLSQAVLTLRTCKLGAALDPHSQRCTDIQKRVFPRCRGFLLPYYLGKLVCMDPEGTERTLNRIIYICRRFSLPESYKMQVSKGIEVVLCGAVPRMAPAM